MSEINKHSKIDLKNQNIHYGHKDSQSPDTPTHLCTELEVDHDNTDLGTGHHQDDEDQEEEAKQIVKLVLPDSLVGKKTHLIVK